MIRITSALFFLFCSLPSYASFMRHFKDEDGHTKWQHVANFSGSVLIVCLSISLIALFFSHRKKVKANRALEEIKNVLEQRVLERTATLDESNRLLRESNTALESEINQHKETSLLLQASETYLKNILQSMPSMLIGLDASLKVTQWNRCAEEITGIEHKKALGKNLWEIYPTITIAPDQVNDVLISGQPFTIKHSQRGQYYFDIRIFPLHGNLDRGTVILVDNVTQQSLAENMLIQRDKMSAMGELASTMAYDMAVPLTAISKDLDNIHKQLSSNAQDESTNAMLPLLTDAKERGEQVSSIIENLLEFARSHGDKKHTAPMTDIIEHAISLANTTLSDPSGLRFQDITIERKIENELPEIPCYIAELQQVYLSLFRHCVHALAKVEKDNFEPKISIEVIECYDALWIKVQHNGVGLSGDEQHDLFEPFANSWPLKSSRIEAENRLSFTHFIITDHHQGQLAITSDVEVGTTFHIQLQLD